MVEIAISLALLLSLVLFARRSYRAVLITAFVLRIALSYAQAFGLILPDSQLDALTFERFAWMWARDGRFLDDFTAGAYLYSWLGSGIYLLFGRSALLLSIVNSYFGTLIVLFAMLVIKRLIPDRRSAVRAGWFVAVYPSAILYSVLTMREALIVLALVISIYALVKWTSTNRLFDWVTAVALMVTAQLFHSGMVAGTLTILVISFFAWMRSVGVRSDVRSAFMAVAGGAALFLAVPAVLETDFGTDKITVLIDTFAVEVLATWHAYAARGRAAYLTTVVVDHWLDLTWFLPLKIVYFLGSPFVWMVSRPDDLLGLADALVFLYLTARIAADTLKGRTLDKDECRRVAFVALAVLCAFALGSSNYGTAFRHRAKLFPLLIILYVYGRNTAVLARARKRVSTARRPAPRSR